MLVIWIGERDDLGFATTLSFACETLLLCKLTWNGIDTGLRVAAWGRWAAARVAPRGKQHVAGVPFGGRVRGRGGPVASCGLLVRPLGCQPVDPGVAELGGAEAGCPG